MALINGPLLSAAASGSFARAMTFAKSKSVQYVKKYQARHFSRSSGQDLMRKRFSIADGVWAALSLPGRFLWALYLGPRAWCKNSPFFKINLNSGYPCREVPELPGVGYNRRVEWIVGLAKIGVTPIGITTMFIDRNL